VKLLAALLLTVTLSGCSALSALGSFMPGGGDGTNVAANTQIGKENTQNGIVGNQSNTRAEGEAQVADQANRVQGTQIINSELPEWLILMLVLLAGWAIPSPNEMVRGIINTIRMIFGKGPIQ
jgi:uncharacterized protein YceK